MVPNPQENDNYAYDNHETKYDSSDVSDNKNDKHAENAATATKNHINGDTSDASKKSKSCWAAKSNNNCDKQSKNGEGYFVFLSHSIVSSLENFFYW